MRDGQQGGFGRYGSAARAGLSPFVSDEVDAYEQELTGDADRTAVIYAEVDPLQGVPGYESFWNVPVAEVSEQPAVQDARRTWERNVLDS